MSCTNISIFLKADRARDTGVYTIRLTCEAGTFEASGRVNVLDVPSKPRNLMPDEVRAEHVKLSWQPPEDDGGTPITNYLVRYMDIDTGEWVSACTVSRKTIDSEVLKIAACCALLRTAFSNVQYFLELEMFPFLRRAAAAPLPRA